jgi:hypothetical protein
MPFLNLVSISTGTDSLNDCAIGVLIVFLANHGVIKTYEDIVEAALESRRQVMEELEAEARRYGVTSMEGILESFDPMTVQLGQDMFERLIQKFLPNDEVEFFIYTTERSPGGGNRGKREVRHLVINQGARGRSAYRLGMKTFKNGGAGHYVLLDTDLATTSQVGEALVNDRFKEKTIKLV